MAATTTAAVAALAAARALFLEAGYDAVSLEAVASRAGCSRQTLYNRFGSKEALFRAVVEEHWSFFDEALFDADRFDPERHDAATVLRAIGELVAEFVHAVDQIAFTRLVIAESRRWPWIAEEFYRLGKEPAVTGLERTLARMVELGQLTGVNPALAARQFLGLIQEFLIWPYVMAIGPATSRLPKPTVVIDEAVAMFLSRYGTGLDAAS